MSRCTCETRPVFNCLVHTDRGMAHRQLASRSADLMRKNAELEAQLAELREAHQANLHQEVRTGWSAKGHRCEWRVAYEAVKQRSKAALLEEGD